MHYIQLKNTKHATTYRIKSTNTKVQNTKVHDTKEMMTLAGEEEDDLGFLLFWATIIMFEEKAKAGDNKEMAFISLVLE